MRIKVNRKLLWDYDISKHPIKDEEFILFYISRVLNKGTLEDVNQIPIKLIKKYIDKLLLSKKVKGFWEWYLSFQ